MNIGVFFKHKQSGGGIYQYFQSVMDNIKRIQGDDRYFLFYCHEPDTLSEYTDAGIRAICLNQSSFLKEGEADYSAYYEGKKVTFRTKPYSRELIFECRKNDIQLMIYTNAEREAFECGKPFLTAILDWTHKTHPQFKEFTADGAYEQRKGSDSWLTLRQQNRN